MTRQKKEILKKIDEIERDIEIDRQLACGMAPPGAYDSMYQQIDDLWVELARLRRYESKEALLFDKRGMLGRGKQENIHKPRKKRNGNGNER